MTIRRTATVITLSAAVVLSSAACSTRRIDPETTGSQTVEGTSWQMFCDGPNAVFWVPGHSGDADELEAYVYDHYKCAPDFYGDDYRITERPADDDGIIEDEDDDS